MLHQGRRLESQKLAQLPSWPSSLFVPRHTLRILLASLLIVAGSSWYRVFAQVEEEANPPPSLQAFPRSRDLSRALFKGAAAVDAKDYAAALGYLGPLASGKYDELFQDSDTPDQEVLEQDYFVFLKRDRNQPISLRHEATRLLKRIPAKELLPFEIKYGSEADSLLKQAQETQDVELLLAVFRNYELTKAGALAGLALGRFYLEQGDAALAAVVLREVTTHPAAREIEAEALLLLAGALHVRGQTADALPSLELAWNRLSKSSSPADTDLRQGLAKLTTEAARTQWLAETFGQPGSLTPPSPTDWLTFRGNEERNAWSPISEPLRTPRWSVPLVNDFDNEQLIGEFERQANIRGQITIPLVAPLAIKDTLLFRSPDALIAVDFKTGKRTWEYHWLQAPLDETRGKTSSDQEFNILRQSLWDNATQARLSANHEYAFVVDAVPPAGPMTVAEWSRGINPRSLGNRLVAISLRDQGKIAWSVGGPSGDREPKLKGAVFLGPPLEHGGTLYVIAEERGNISLVALNAATGQQLWRQELLALEHSIQAYTSLRQMSGISPTLANGYLICPTSAGVIAAVDLTTRRFAWATRYDRRATENARATGPLRGADRWRDSVPIIAGGKILLPAADFAELVCLDLLTGKIAWSISRGDMQFIGGVTGDIVMGVGRKSLVGVRLADGQAAWPDVQFAGPSGMGVQHAASYWLSTIEGDLLEFDMSQGKIAKSIRMNAALGNLITHDNCVVALSPSGLTKFALREPLAKEVDDRLKSNANDPWAVGRRGEIALHDGKLEEAWQLLQRAFAANPSDYALTPLLAEAGILLLEKSYQQHREIAAQLEPLISSAEHKNRFHQQLALGKLAERDYVGVFQSLVSMSRERGQVDQHRLRATAWRESGPTYRAQLDRWLARLSASTYEQAKPSEQAAIDQLLQREQTRLSTASLAEKRNYVENFGFHLSSHELMLETAADYIANSHWLEAELMLRPLLLEETTASSARAAGLYLRLLVDAERWVEAADWSAVIARRFANQVVDQGRTGAEIQRHYESRLDFRLGAAHAAPQYPRGKIEVEEDRGSERQFVDQRQLFTIPLQQHDPFFGEGIRLIYDASQGVLRVHDSFGRTLARFSLQNSNRQFYSNLPAIYTARLCGHLLVVHTGNEVITIDLWRSQLAGNEGILWRQEVFDSAQQQGEFRFLRAKTVSNPWTISKTVASDTANRPLANTACIASQGVCFLRRRELVCVDFITGETLWQRSDIAPGVELFGGNDHVFVVNSLSPPETTTTARSFLALDGSLGETRGIELSERRIATCGSHVLSWSSKESEMGGTKSTRLELFLDDLQTGKRVWTHASTQGGKAWFTGYDEIAIFEPTGRFLVRSLCDDKIRLERQLPPEPNLRQLYALKSRQGYLVAIAQPETQPLEQTHLLTVASRASGSPLFSGKLYMLSREGQSLWPSAAAISQFGLPLDQPVDQPVLLFLRSKRSSTNTEAARWTTDVLALDKRTGALALEARDISVQAGSYELEPETEGQRIRLAVPERTFWLKFSNNATPPQPPVQFDEAFAVKPGGGSRIGKAFMKLFNGDSSSPSPDDELFGDDPFR